MLPARPDCTQRKHASCNVSFILPHDLCKHKVQIVMHVLQRASVPPPIVLNANTLCVTFHLFYRTIYASIKCGDSNARLAACFRCAPIVLNANTLCVTFHLFCRTIYASIKSEDSNARLAACFRHAPIVLNANTLRVIFHFIKHTSLCKHIRALYKMKHPHK